MCCVQIRDPKMPFTVRLNRGLMMPDIPTQKGRAIQCVVAGDDLLHGGETSSNELCNSDIVSKTSTGNK
jgi:hypothetical protein